MFKVLAIATLMMGSNVFAGQLIKFNQGSFDPLSSSARNLKTQDTPELLVQYHSQIMVSDQTALENLGFEILRYLPDDTYIVRAKNSEATEKQILEQNNVRAVTGLPVVYKISGLFKTNEFSRAKNLEQVIQVKAWSTSDRDHLVNLLMASPFGHLQVKAMGLRNIILTGPNSLAAFLVNQSGVEFIQPALQMRPMVMDEPATTNTINYGVGDYSDMTGNESGTNVMNFPALYELGFTGRDAIVAVADTGLDSGVPATLLADVRDNFKEAQIYGQFSKSWDDYNGHGTHVAGSVVGNGANSGGKVRGGAYEAKVIMQSLWNYFYASLTLPKDLADLFAPAYKIGARVHSNSWGSTAALGEYDSNAQEADDFMFKNPDMLLVFAAGNSGIDKNRDGKIDASSIVTPATAKNVLTVGASENLELTRSRRTPQDFAGWESKWPADPISTGKISDNVNGIAMFSSRGPTADGRIKPDVLAPGANVLSLHSQIEGAKLWGDYNKMYTWAGGTSMATPLTSAAAALTRQYLIDRMKVANPSAALVKATLMLTAFDIFPGQYGTGEFQEVKSTRPEPNEGFGRVDLSSVANFDKVGTVIDEKVGVGSKEEMVYPVTFLENGTLEAHLVYTDAPGSPSAKTALVNDLDLVLVDSAGKVLSEKTDRLNNYEYLSQSLPAGSYSLKVRGFNVPSGSKGKQHFALVYRYVSTPSNPTQ